MDKEKIIQALVTIKEICEEHRLCTDCPFRGARDRDGYITCSIKNHVPKNWTISIEPEPWKAFKW